MASRRVNQDLTVIARFEVRYRDYLAPDGSINRPLPAFASDASLLFSLYRAMVLLRNFDRKAVALQRTGLKLEEILLFWGGDERGNHFSGPAEDFPFCVPVGSQAPHAAGVAYAFKLRKEPRVAVCMFGDGATSKGTSTKP